MCVVLLVSTLVVTGCSRRRYRLAADKQAYDLIAEKGAMCPAWDTGPWNVYGDPRSRFFDPCNPDRPPMPPDDPCSHTFMRDIDGMKGWKHWNDFGSRSQLDNPKWREQLVEYARFNDKDEVVLDVDSSLQLAVIHSSRLLEPAGDDLPVGVGREHGAIPVRSAVLRRQRHAVRPFGTACSGSNLPSNRGRGLGGADNLSLGEVNNLRTSTDAWVQKKFATAGEIVVGFANSAVWTFAGPDTHATGSLLNMNLVQPLLRGAGKDVALEQLTIVERNLLANLRAFQRYRHGFYTQVAVGESGVSGPSRRGGFLGGTGLTGFTGSGIRRSGRGRGRHRVRKLVRAAAPAAPAAEPVPDSPAAGPGTIGGFIGLLQQLQQIRNTEDSLALQLNQLAKLESYHAAGLITLIQVDNLRQAIETEKATLLQSRNAFLATLDNFKVSTMGLPPDLPVALDDSLIRQFQFLDPRATAISRVSPHCDPRQAACLPSRQPDQLKTAVAGARTIEQQLDKHFRAIDDGLPDTRRADAAAIAGHDARRSGAVPVGDRAGTRQAGADQAAVRILLRQHGLDRREDRAGSARRIAPQDRRVDWRFRPTGRGSVALVQARARLESIILEPVKLDSHDALDTALANRLDVMNSRAALVDSWRLIAFNADALRSDVTVTFGADMTTTGDNPVKFRSSDRFVAGLVADRPAVHTFAGTKQLPPVPDRLQPGSAAVHPVHGQNPPDACGT